MRKTSYIIGSLVLALIVLSIIPYVGLILKFIFIPEEGAFWANEPIYFSFMMGILFALVFKLVFKDRTLFIETFSHELTHAIMAILFWRKVIAFHVEDSGSGMVYTSKQDNYTLVPVSLAPYCLPVFSYLCLAIRCIVSADSLWIIDFITGITCGFHYICFRSQLRDTQPDINQYPLYFSYSYIGTAWLVNCCVILVSFFPSMNEPGGTWQYGVFSSLCRLILECRHNLIGYGEAFASFILGIIA